MRLIAVLIASLIASAASAAEGWREYIYPGLKFAVGFPAPPKIEEVDYAHVGGMTVRARVYSLAQDNKIYKVTVADFASTGLDQFAILDLGIEMVARTTTIKLDQLCHYNLVDICREMSLVGADGSHTTVASVYYQQKLYQIEGTVLPLNDDPASGDTIRFQHSFRLTDFAYQ